MSARELLGYWSNIPRLEAEDELRARRARTPMSADRLFDLVLLSTGNRRAAERAFIEFRHAELRAGITPGQSDGG